MPKLTKRLPKYCKLNQYAVVYQNGKPVYLGLHGSPESKVAYSRFIAEIQANQVFSLTKEERAITICELTAAFLDHAKLTLDSTGYSFYRVIIFDFLDKLYGDGTVVSDFTPRCLKLVREEMIRSHRFCRNILNRCVNCIVTIFGWGVGEELVPETTWRALKAVKALSEGHPDTFDHKEREPVPDDVIRRTLPFMPPTLRTMVMLQRILGVRPNEIFNMRVGDIDTTRRNGLWYYEPEAYKTSRFIGKIVFPLGKPEQELLAPYLKGKKSEDAVFSPRAAMAERNAEKRASRKTKITPSQEARNAERAVNPKEYREFYNRDSYRRAVENAIVKGNKSLPDDQQIPHWFPYLLRNSAATAIESEVGLDEAQAQLGHKTADMTRRYSKAQLRIREELARNRRNPFDAGRE